jgi:hypothetical protein
LGPPTRLTLDANYNVAVKAAVTVAGTAGLTIVTNDGSTGGDLVFTPTGNVSFWDVNSSLIINGLSYVLANSVAGLASAIAAHPSVHFALASDYDASPDGRYTDAPITDLEGTFEGLGHEITGLRVRSRNPAGLFLSVGYRAIVRDVHLENVEIYGSGKYGIAGGIAGQSQGVIMSSSVQGLIKAKGTYDEAGGIVGSAAGMVVGCSTSGQVRARYSAGGIVGWNYATIRTSHSDAAVNSDSVGGGIAGINYYGTVDQSFATGPVTASGAGGIVGDQRDGQISNSYATGAIVSQGGTAGGIAAFVGYRGDGATATVAMSYSTASVRGTIAGGVLGADVQNGRGNQNLYWDLDASGISDPSQGAGSPQDDPGITGLTDGQLKSGLPAGFDPAIWGQKKKINGGYPYLLANPPPK